MVAPVVIGAAIEIGTKLIDRWFPDPNVAAEKKLDLLRLQQSGDLQITSQQSEINKIEAGSASVFVSGWRPFIGWVCGIACAWNWIGLPIMRAVLAWHQIPFNLQSADITEMLPVLLGMLGLGGMRTIERLNGAARER